MLSRSGCLALALTIGASLAWPGNVAAQTAWFWSRAYDGPQTSVGISSRVASPQQTVFGTLPRAGLVGEVAVEQSAISVGDLVPLPRYADGSPATESEVFWTAQLWRAGFRDLVELDQLGDASATFSGRQLTSINVQWGRGFFTGGKVLVQVVAVRPHDNRRSNR